MAMSTLAAPACNFEFATVEEVSTLSLTLQQLHGSVRAGHSAITAAWRGPVSLFGATADTAAIGSGVAAWAVSAVGTAQLLAIEAAELCDFADVYMAQVELASREAAESEGSLNHSRRGLLRTPLVSLIERLESLSRRLAAHVPRLKAARAAFDAPSASSPAPSQEACVTSGVAVPSPEEAGHGCAELPITILCDRAAVSYRKGDVWRKPQCKSKPAAHGFFSSARFLEGPLNRKAVARRLVDMRVTLRSDAKDFVTGTHYAALGLLGYPMTFDSDSCPASGHDGVGDIAADVHEDDNSVKAQVVAHERAVQHMIPFVPFTPAPTATALGLAPAAASHRRVSDDSTGLS
mmetsp:Transcript_42018/g.116000  ORF Transcript_42018/g.116000 Transcript_42018/m.116000 type:complete len:349 (-) Transcript_42018:27-1073(-)